jgi:hypothetical protein
MFWQCEMKNDTLTCNYPFCSIISCSPNHCMVLLHTFQQTHPWVVPQGTSHPNFFWTHSILQQHRTHLWKGFILNFISKEYPSHVRFETSIGFTKTLILRFQMSGQGKSFKKVSFGIRLFTLFISGSFDRFEWLFIGL